MPNRVLLKATSLFSIVAFFIATGPRNCIAAESRPEVLIYYVNETAAEGREAENYDTIIAWLRSGDQAIHRHVAASLLRDRHIFMASVDTEVDALTFEIPHLYQGRRR